MHTLYYGSGNHYNSGCWNDGVTNARRADERDKLNGSGNEKLYSESANHFRHISGAILKLISYFALICSAHHQIVLKNAYLFKVRANL